MDRNKRYWLFNMLACCIAVFSQPILAGAPQAEADVVVLQSSARSNGENDPRAVFPEALSSKQLEQTTGRQGVAMQLQFNNNRQDALVSDNVLSGNVLTGTNSISDNAFENMSGIATVIQNTGNQVVIQDSTMINILINQ